MKNSIRGFTIIELAFSIALISGLVCGVVQIVNHAAAITSSSQKHSRADRQARSLFERMASDFGTMPVRPDLDYVFSKQDGREGGASDTFFFYSEAPGYFDSWTDTSNRSSLSLVGYRINASNQLERLGKGLAWAGPATGTKPGGALFHRPGSKGAPADPATTLDRNWNSTIGAAPQFQGMDDDYHVLGDAVFRIEFCFQFTNGTFGNHPGKGGDNLRPGLEGVASIIVAVAVLDRSQSVAKSTLDRLCSGLPDVSDLDLAMEPPLLMAQLWQRTLAEPGLAGRIQVPPNVLAGVRVYQRSFPVLQP